MKLRQPAHSAEANTEIRHVRYQIDGAVIGLHQSDTPSSDEHSRKFVADYRHQYIEHLYAAQQAGVFQNMIIGVFFHV